TPSVAFRASQWTTFSRFPERHRGRSLQEASASLSFAAGHAKLLAAFSPLLCCSCVAMAKPKSSGGTLLVQKSRPRKSRPGQSRQGRATSVPASSASIYSVHPGIAMIQKWVGELKAKTGRSLDEWLRHIKTDGPADESDCREWLKNAYQLGTNTAGW